MATDITTRRADIMALQAPLLSLAYILTGNRTEAYNLLRDTTRRAMMATDGLPISRESLFRSMRSIFAASYSGRAVKRQMEAPTRPYNLPAHVSMADAADDIPEGTVSAHTAGALLGAIADTRYSSLLAKRAAGYRFREIARETGLSLLTVRIRVALASISLRAAAAL